ncbi:hypothetical protein N5F07_13515 [Pseudomonas chengduensis]|nr:hypothetical protein [Pseudomonas chengduensis]MDH1622185.1 hypothetical protein [Pseudomonas chengduensis]
MRLKLNERAQEELLAVMKLMGLSESNPTYVLHKLITEQYNQMKNPEREVMNVNEEYHHH